MHQGRGKETKERKIEVTAGSTDDTLSFRGERSIHVDTLQVGTVPPHQNRTSTSEPYLHIRTVPPHQSRTFTSEPYLHIRAVLSHKNRTSTSGSSSRRGENSPPIFFASGLMASLITASTSDRCSEEIPAANGNLPDRQCLIQTRLYRGMARTSGSTSCVDAALFTAWWEGSRVCTMTRPPSVAGRAQLTALSRSWYVCSAARKSGTCNPESAWRMPTNPLRGNGSR